MTTADFVKTVLFSGRVAYPGPGLAVPQWAEVTPDALIPAAGLAEISFTGDAGPFFPFDYAYLTRRDATMDSADPHLDGRDAVLFSGVPAGPAQAAVDLRLGHTDDARFLVSASADPAGAALALIIRTITPAAAESPLPPDLAAALAEEERYRDALRRSMQALAETNALSVSIEGRTVSRQSLPQLRQELTAVTIRINRLKARALGQAYSWETIRQVRA